MRKKTRSGALGTLTIGATLVATAAPAPQAPPPTTAPPIIREMIDRAHLALATGKAAEAADLFEAAAEHGEYIEAEVGEVRARLWAGQFRHAVTISNVVAGEHPESAEAQALLGFIEDRNGYTGPALQRLRKEENIHPDAPAPIAAEAEVLIDRHLAVDAITVVDRWVSTHGTDPALCRLRARAILVQSAGMLDNTHRGAVPTAHSPCGTADAERGSGQRQAAPDGWYEPPGSAFPTALNIPLAAGNGLVMDGGKSIVTLKRLVDSPAASIWVRNFRGELRRARLDTEPTTADNQRIAAGHDGDPVAFPAIAHLSLSAALPSDQSLSEQVIAPLTTHGLCFALGFPAALSTDAMLPAVTPCFAIDSRAANGQLQLNVPLSATEVGTPIFDALGQLVGLADPHLGKAGVIRMTPTGDSGKTASEQGGATDRNRATVAMPELYERLAPAVVQILVFAAAPHEQPTASTAPQ